MLLRSRVDNFWNMIKKVVLTDGLKGLTSIPKDKIFLCLRLLQVLFYSIDASGLNPNIRTIQFDQNLKALRFRVLKR